MKNSDSTVAGEEFSAVLAAGGGRIIVPGGEAFLLAAEFMRSGPDLILIGPDGQQILIVGFFQGEATDLATESGAIIDSQLAAKLAGPLAPGQFAQAEGADLLAPIGKVSIANGKVEVRRGDGSRAELNVGDDVYQDDVLTTAQGGAVGLTFLDGTTFSLGSAGRMVLDEMVYDAGAQTGSASISVVSGAFTLVSGAIPKVMPDAMHLKTPAMTIGIRGTGVASDGNTVALMEERGGITGEITVTTPGGQTLTLNQPGAAATVGPNGLTATTFTPAQINQMVGNALGALPNRENSLSQPYNDSVDQGEPPQNQPPPPAPPPEVPSNTGSVGEAANAVMMAALADANKAVTAIRELSDRNADDARDIAEDAKREELDLLAAARAAEEAAAAVRVKVFSDKADYWAGIAASAAEGASASLTNLADANMYAAQAAAAAAAAKAAYFAAAAEVANYGPDVIAAVTQAVEDAEAKALLAQTDSANASTHAADAEAAAAAAEAADDGAVPVGAGWGSLAAAEMTRAAEKWEAAELDSGYAEGFAQSAANLDASSASWRSTITGNVDDPDVSAIWRRMAREEVENEKRVEVDEAKTAYDTALAEAEAKELATYEPMIRQAGTAAAKESRQLSFDSAYEAYESAYVAQYGSTTGIKTEVELAADPAPTDADALVDAWLSGAVSAKSALTEATDADDAAQLDVDAALDAYAIAKGAADTNGTAYNTAVVAVTEAATLRGTAEAQELAAQAAAQAQAEADMDAALSAANTQLANATSASQDAEAQAEIATAATTTGDAGTALGNAEGFRDAANTAAGLANDALTAAGEARDLALSNTLPGNALFASAPDSVRTAALQAYETAQSLYNQVAAIQQEAAKLAAQAQSSVDLAQQSFDLLSVAEVADTAVAQAAAGTAVTAADAAVDRADTAVADALAAKTSAEALLVQLTEKYPTATALLNSATQAVSQITTAYNAAVTARNSAAIQENAAENANTNAAAASTLEAARDAAQAAATAAKSASQAASTAASQASLASNLLVGARNTVSAYEVAAGRAADAAAAQDALTAATTAKSNADSAYSTAATAKALAATALTEAENDKAAAQAAVTRLTDSGAGTADPHSLTLATRALQQADAAFVNATKLNTIATDALTAAATKQTAMNSAFSTLEKAVASTLAANTNGQATASHLATAIKAAEAVTIAATEAQRLANTANTTATDSRAQSLSADGHRISAENAEVAAQTSISVKTHSDAAVTAAANAANAAKIALAKLGDAESAAASATTYVGVGNFTDLSVIQAYLTAADTARSDAAAAVATASAQVTAANAARDAAEGLVATLAAGEAGTLARSLADRASSAASQAQASLAAAQRDLTAAQSAYNTAKDSYDVASGAVATATLLDTLRTQTEGAEAAAQTSLAKATASKAAADTALTTAQAKLAAIIDLGGSPTAVSEWIDAQQLKAATAVAAAQASVTAAASAVTAATTAKTAITDSITNTNWTTVGTAKAAADAAAVEAANASRQAQIAQAHAERAAQAANTTTDLKAGYDSYVAEYNAKVAAQTVADAKPTAVADSVTLDEDGSVDLNVLANDTNAASAPLVFASSGDGARVTSVGAPANGTAIINADGTIKYTPKADFSGSDSFTYTISNTVTVNGVTTVHTATGTASITVTAVNDAPVVSVSTSALSYTEGTSVSVAPTLTVTDVDSTSLASASITIGGFVLGQDQLDFTDQGSITGSFDAQTGVLTLTGAASLAAYQTALRSVTYTNTSQSPDESPRTITITVDDGTAASTVVSRQLTVTAVNDAPTLGTPAPVTGTEDVAAVILATTFTDAYSDPEGDALTSVRIDGLAANGTMLLSGSAVAEGQVIDVADIGNLSFMPDAHWNGTTSFSWSASDGTGWSAPVSASITINPVQDAPVLTGDAALAAINEDPEFLGGTPVSTIMASSFSDPDDGASMSGIAVVANTADAATEGVWRFFTGTAWADIGPASEAASVALSASTMLMFVPAANYNGTPTGLVVRALDDTYAGEWSSDAGPFVTVDTTVNGGSTAISTEAGTIGITVTPTNDAPTFSGGVTMESISNRVTDPDGATIAELFGPVFSDIDGDSLGGIAVTSAYVINGAWQYSTDTGATWHGIGDIYDPAAALALSASTMVRFVPNAGYVGVADNLFAAPVDESYQGAWTAGGARVSVDTNLFDPYKAFGSPVFLSQTITLVNDAPVPSSFFVSGTEDTALAIGSSPFLDAYSDADGDALDSIEILTLGPGGDLKLSGTVVTINQVIAAADLPNLTFDPSLDWNGETSFTWRAFDGYEWSGVATAYLSIAMVNDAPVITSQEALEAFTESQVLRMVEVPTSAGMIIPAYADLTVVPGDDWTVMANVRPDTHGAILKQLAYNGEQELLLSLESSGAISFALGRQSFGWDWKSVPAGQFEFGEWVHLAFVKDGNVGRVLVDGQVVLESTFNTDVLNSNATTHSDPLRLFEMQGALTEFQMFKTALGAADVQQWIAGTGTPGDASLLLHYGEGAGYGTSGLTDISSVGNNHSLTFAGGQTWAEQKAPLFASGQITFTDVDAGDTHEVSLAGTDISATGVTLTLEQIATIEAALAVDASGVWTFQMAAPDYLPDGAVVNAIFTIAVSDGIATTTQDVTVAIIGTNDAPIIDAFDAGLTLSEDGTSTGTVAGSDVDAGATIDYYLLDGGGLRVVELVTENGTVTINPATGEYTFVPSAAMQSLGQGATASDSFQVIAFDGTAESAPQTVGVTITGTNDAPVIDTFDVLVVSEDGTASGTVAGSDVDVGDGVTYFLRDGDANRVTSMVTVHGSVIIDSATGEYTYTPSAAMQALGEGVTAADSFQVVAFDGVAESAPQTVGVTITGTNDAPIVGASIDFGTMSGSVVFLATADLLANASDGDDGDTLSVVNLSADGTFSPGTDSDGNPGFFFTPNVGIVGPVVINYGVSDGLAITAATANLTLHSLTVSGAATGGMLSFDGVDDMASATVAMSAAAGTIELWVQKNWAAVNEQNIIGNDRSGYTAGAVYISDHHEGGLHFRYGGLTQDTGETFINFDGSRLWANDSWHHVAATWEHEAGITTLRLFADGQQVATTTTTLLIDATALQSWVLGKDSHPDALVQDWLDGAVDDVRMWSVARTEAEIQSSFQLGEPAATTGLLANWTMDAVENGAISDANGGPALTLGSTGAIEAGDPVPVNVTSIAVGDGMSYMGQFLATDRDGQTITYALQTNPTNGTLTLDFNDGGYTYVPNAGYLGADSFTLSATTGLETITQTVSVTVAVNQSLSFVGGEADSGGYLTFDGTDDFGQAMGIDLANQSFSLEAWAYRDEDSWFDFLISQGTSSTNEGLHFGYRPGSEFTFAFFGDDLNYVDATSNVGEWAHWAGTYDALTGDRILYKNGVEVARDVELNNYAGSGPLLLGSYFGMGLNFGGKMDDVRIWSDVRSAEEIAANYQTQLTGAEAGLTANWVFDQVSGGMVADASGNGYDLILGDTTGVDANDPALTGSPIDGPPMAPEAITVTDGATYNGQILAVDTDGLPITYGVATHPARGTLTVNPDGSYSYVPDDASSGTDSFTVTASSGAETISQVISVNLEGTDPFSIAGIANAGGMLAFDGVDDMAGATVAMSATAGTIEMWVQKDWAAPNDQNIIGNDRSGATAGAVYISDHHTVGLHFRYGGVGMDPGDTNIDWVGSRSWADNSWHHVAATWEHEAGTTTLRLFADGQQVATTTTTLLLDVSVLQNWVVGKDTYPGVAQAQDWLKGAVDDVRMWDVARTEAEIQSSYQLREPATVDGLLANWTMDEVAGGEVLAANSGGPALTVTGARLIDAPPRAMTFDGVDDYVTVAGDFGIGTGALTFEAWINTSNTVDRQAVLSLGEDSYRESAYLYVEGGTLHFGMALQYGVNTGVTVADGQWHHVAAVLEPTGTVTVYVDGNAAGTHSFDYNAGVEGGYYHISDGPAVIGATYSYGTQYFQGQIADARVWDIARTPDDIAGGMNVRPGDDEFGLLLSAPLDNVQAGNWTMTSGDMGWVSTNVYGMPTLEAIKPPSAMDTIEVREDTPFNGKLVIDGAYSTLAVADGGHPLNGHLRLNDDGTFSYRPNDEYVGSDSFTVVATDSNGFSVTKTFQIDVAEVDDPADLEPPPAYEHNALRLHGSAASYVEIDPALATGTSPLTIEAWVRTGSTATMGLVVMGDPDVYAGEARLMMHEGKLHFGFSHVAGVSSVSTIADDEWHHVAVTLTGSGEIVLYVDGIAETTHNFGVAYDISQSLASIGSLHGSNLNGAISDVRIWTEHRTAQQVIDGMVTPPEPTDPALHAWWTFAEGSGTTVNDIAGGFTGTVMGDTHWTDDVYAVTKADTALAIDGTTIFDPDAVANLPGTLRVVIEAEHGILTLGSTAGLTFIDGSANGTSMLAFTGSASDINAALASATYQPDTGFTGRDGISFLVDEMDANLTRMNGGVMAVLVVADAGVGVVGGEIAALNGFFFFTQAMADDGGAYVIRNSEVGDATLDMSTITNFERTLEGVRRVGDNLEFTFFSGSVLTIEDHFTTGQVQWMRDDVGDMRMAQGLTEEVGAQGYDHLFFGPVTGATGDVIGGAGEDYLIWQGGDGSFDGGGGYYNGVSFVNGTSGVVVDLTLTEVGAEFWGQATIGGVTTYLRNVNEVDGTGYSDSMTGSADHNRVEFRGYAGTDSFTGGGGSVFVLYDWAQTGITMTAASSVMTVAYAAGTSYAAGSDTLTGILGVKGTDFADTLDARGSNQFHVLSGEAGDDILYAGEYGSHLEGGAGRDILYGGTGEDTFAWAYDDTGLSGTTRETTDVIVGFDVALDYIGLWNAPGVSFSTAAAGYSVWATAAGAGDVDTLLNVSLTDSAIADFTIYVDNVHYLDWDETWFTGLGPAELVEFTEDGVTGDVWGNWYDPITIDMSTGSIYDDFEPLMEIPNSLTNMTVSVEGAGVTVIGNDLDNYIQGSSLDSVQAGIGDDTIGIYSGEFSTIEGGAGMDTLAFLGDDMAMLDLTAILGSVTGVEIVDLSATGGQTLVIDGMLAGTISDAVNSATGVANSLVILGQGDTVELMDGGWSAGSTNATIPADGIGSYSIYSHTDGAQVYVENNGNTVHLPTVA